MTNTNRPEKSRYEIRAISDAECTEVHDEVLAATDDSAEAQRLAAQHSASLYGSAIIDTVTGEIDFGGAQ